MPFDKPEDWTPDAINAARDAEASDQSLALRSNLMQNTDADPVKAAAALPIARAKGVPLQTVENNLPTFQKQEDWTPDNVNALRDNSPVLADFLAQPDNVRVAHQDIPLLQRMENTLSQVPQAFEAGEKKTLLYDLRDKQIRGTATGGEIAQANTLSEQLANEAPAEGTGGYISKGVLGLAGFIPTLADVAKGTRTGMLAGGALGAAAGAVSGPGELLTVPTGAAAGGVVGGWNAWRGQVAGQVYDDLLRYKGKDGETIDPDTARYAAFGAGIIGGMAGQLPIHTALNTLPAFQMLQQAGVDKAAGFFTEKGVRAAIQKPGMAVALANIGRKYAENVAATGAATAAFQATTMYSEELAKHLSDPKYQGMTGDEQISALADSFIGGTAMGVVTGLPGTMLSTGDALVSRNKQPHPQAVADYVRQGTDMAKASELQKLSPDMFKDFAKGATKDGDFYIPAEQAMKLYQSVPPESRDAFDAAVPDFQEKLAESAVTGADVKVSQADYFTHMAEHAPKDMPDHIKFDPSHLNMADYQDHDLVQQLMDEGQQDRQPDEILHRNMTDYFENSGLTPDVSRKYADLVTARYTTMMERYGDNEQAAATAQAMADQLRVQPELPDFVQAANKADALDVLISRARSLRQGASQPKYPILAWLKSRGGVHPDSQQAQDLRAMGINGKTVPGIFSKKAGGGIDNIPANEFESKFGTVHTEDGQGGDNGNVNLPWLMNAIEDEYKMGVTLERSEKSPEEQFSDELYRLGVDIDKDSNATIKKAIQDYLDKQSDQDMLFQAAYHGTPYNFDKFTLDHIGKGEGAQAYGWGLYFASDKSVAEYYRNALSGIRYENPKTGKEVSTRQVERLIGKRLEKEYAASKHVADIFSTRSNSAPKDLPEKDGGWMKHWTQEVTGRVWSAEDQSLWERSVEMWGDYTQKEKGQLYEAEIPEDHAMLDWDKPLSKQPETVKLALPELIQQLKKSFPGFDESTATGQGLYRAYKSHRGGNAETASLAMKDAGIGGIKYLDGNSRSKGEGKHNYVVFDDSAIKILNKLYQNEPGNADLIRGYFQRIGDEGARITLTKNMNLTTSIHELAHWFSFTQAKLAAVDERAAADWDIIKKHLGAEGQETLTVEQEERFARMFEAYAAEGKAPSVELQSAFQSFKAWIIRAYKRLTRADGTVAQALGVNMTAESRDFFDRMLATDDQIEQLRGQPGFSPDEAVLGILTKAEQDRYRRISEREDSAAKEKLLSASIRQKEREYTKFYKEERGQVEKDVTDHVLHSQLYRAMNFLRTGAFHEGDTAQAPPVFKLARRKARGVIGKELADRLPAAYYGRNGVHPDAAAEMLGYTTGQELLLDLLNAQPAKATIERMTNDEMQRRHGDMMKDGTLEREAIDNMINEYRAQRLEMEGRAAAAQAKIPFPAGTNFKAAARNIIGERNVIDAGNANRYYLAGKAAARAFGKAIGKEDFFKAAAEKQKELLNHHLYREAIEAKADLDKALKSWRRLRKPDAKLTGTASGRMDVNFLYLARGILSRYGLMSFKQDIGKYVENLQKIDPQAWEDVRVAYEDNTAMAASAPDGSAAWKQISLNEFRALRDAVDNIVSVGKGQNEVMVEGKKIGRDEVLGRIEEDMARRKGSGLPTGMEQALTELQKTKKGFYSFRALFIRMESWAKVMDGGPQGLYHDLLIRPIFDAKDRYGTRRDEVMADLYNIVGTQQDNLLESGKVIAHEIGYTFRDKAALLGMMLHTGNESNYDKLWRGRKWDPARIQNMLTRMYADGTITKNDMDTVQGLWDVAEKLKPDAWRAYKEMYGHYPQEVIASPVETPFGNYRGGYWPAIVDRNISDDAALKQDRDSIVASNATGLFPSTTLGPTKSRVEGYAGPLSFDLNLLPQHIDKMLRITYLQPAVRDVAKIVMHPRFRDALSPIDPGIARTAIVPYLWRTVNQITEIESTGGVVGLQMLNRWAGALRQSAAGQTLMYNITNAMQQLTGAFASMKDTGAAPLMEQIGLYARNPKSFMDDIQDKSPFMRSRMSVIGRETKRGVDDILKGKSDFQKTAEKMNNQGYILYHITQGFVDHVTWAAAYNNAIGGEIPNAKGQVMHETDAIKYADSVVRARQGAAEPESIATYEAGPAWQKLFTMFSGYWNSQANSIGSDLVMLGKDYAGQGGAKSLFLTYLYGIALPGIASRLIYDGIKGTLPPTDDKKKMAIWLAGANVNQVGGMLPYVGSEANALWNHYAENKPMFNDSVFSSPAMSSTKKVFDTPGEIVGAANGTVDPGKALQDTMFSLGLVLGTVPGSPVYGSGVPLGQLGKPAGYALDLVTGHAKPKGIPQLVQGMVIGPNKQNTQ